LTSDSTIAVDPFELLISQEVMISKIIVRVVRTNINSPWSRMLVFFKEIKAVIC
jgi:hypothetical protein